MELIAQRDLYFGRGPGGYVRAGDAFEVSYKPDALRLIEEGKAYPVPPKQVLATVSIAGPGSVSCIMPTKNRRQFVPRAIACFLAQSYEPRELIVLDNGDSILDLVPKLPNIRYMRMPAKQTTGQLRNLCCQLAAAEFIAHWDDDDWSHPLRLEEQIAAIGDKQVTGYRSMLFTGDKGVFRYSGADNYALGTSLLYRRSWWQKHQFPAHMVGEDTQFVERAKGVIGSFEGMHRMVASAHSSNTSPRSFTGDSWFPATEKELPKEYVACQSGL